ncbi:hypothetical protein MARPO_0084s0021 [Marchantia polymorpha]|uniref:Uncharacterized protein n=1 Tax=Marchantia polymorpha TaxID=3197 RepID=A0A2R6WJC0_MARPO|nr:hypothetical protein MARPO_0084s0021 [Marchantia polymorpha]|eukprot:PTQ33929.1 hypothetical protein MARPO_0084s0021 [Marchantia polymorpha]
MLCSSFPLLTSYALSSEEMKMKAKMFSSIFVVLTVSLTNLTVQGVSFYTPGNYTESGQHKPNSSAVSPLQNESSGDKFLRKEVDEMHLLPAKDEDMFQSLEHEGDPSADAAACTKSLGRNASERWESDTVFDFDFLKSGVPVLSDQTNQPPPVDPRNVIMIIVYNQIPTDVIRVRCQSLHNSERMRDYGYRTICPLDQITWLVIQVNYQPDEVRCLFFWGRLSVLHSVYIDSPHHTTPTESYWMATTNGLNEYVHGLGYVLIKPWRNNSLNEFDW